MVCLVGGEAEEAAVGLPALEVPPLHDAAWFEYTWGRKKGEQQR